MSDNEHNSEPDNHGKGTPGFGTSAWAKGMTSSTCQWPPIERLLNPDAVKDSWMSPAATASLRGAWREKEQMFWPSTSLRR